MHFLSVGTWILHITRPLRLNSAFFLLSGLILTSESISNKIEYHTISNGTWNGKINFIRASPRIRVPQRTFGVDNPAYARSKRVVFNPIVQRDVCNQVKVFLSFHRWRCSAGLARAIFVTTKVSGHLSLVPNSNSVVDYIVRWCADVRVLSRHASLLYIT